MTVTIETN